METRQAEGLKRRSSFLKLNEEVLSIDGERPFILQHPSRYLKTSAFISKTYITCIKIRGNPNKKKFNVTICFSSKQKRIQFLSHCDMDLQKFLYLTRNDGAIFSKYLAKTYVSYKYLQDGARALRLFKNLINKIDELQGLEATFKLNLHNMLSVGKYTFYQPEENAQKEQNTMIDLLK